MHNGHTNIRPFPTARAVWVIWQACGCLAACSLVPVRCAAQESDQRADRLLAFSGSSGLRNAGPTTTTVPVIPKDIADVEIALGRLRMVPDRFRIVRKHETSATEGYERIIQVATAEGRPTLRLSYVDNSEKWTLRIDSIIGAQWTREIKSGAGLVTVNFSQPPDRPIAIDISGHSAKPARLVGATLWHLTEQNALEFQQFVLPSLKRLNSNWDLPAALASAKRMLRQCEGMQDSSCGNAIQKCVADLESSDHSTRLAAMESLRSVGLAAQLPLERMSQQSLTAHQRSAIRQLLAELEPRSADTPTRLAYWLSGDPNWR